jgi:hypothetical protein
MSALLASACLAIAALLAWWGIFWILWDEGGESLAAFFGTLFVIAAAGSEVGGAALIWSKTHATLSLRMRAATVSLITQGVVVGLGLVLLAATDALHPHRIAALVLCALLVFVAWSTWEFGVREHRRVPDLAGT